MTEPPVVQAAAEPPQAAAPDAKERRYPCKGCGARLEFKVGTTSIHCTYCGFTEAVPASKQAIEEYAFNEVLAEPPRGLEPGGRDVRCPQCGAITHLEKTTKATRCGFCGAAVVDASDDSAGADVRPEAVTPFTIPKGDAERRFKEWVSKLWFAPGNLRHEAQRAVLQGMYVPYWTYDSQTYSHYEGERGDYYYTTESYTTMVNGKPVVQTRQVRHVRWSWVQGTHEAYFDDVVVPGSPQSSELALGYDVKSLQPYSPQFLAGFEAQRPSVDVRAGWTSAKEAIDQSLLMQCRRRIGGDEQRSVRVKTAYRGIAFKLVLLPVWISSYRFGEKVYRFRVHGRSGAVQGQRPWSVAKIVLAVLGLLLLAGAIVAVVAFARSNR